MNRALFIHHRDLRHADNIGLARALRECDEVFPIFIFCSAQVEKNEYHNQRSIDFMIESLRELKNVTFFRGEIEKVIPKLIAAHKITHIYENADVTPFAVAREKSMRKLCAATGAKHVLCDDVSLRPIGDLLKANGEPYRIFTPFFRNASKYPVLPPTALTYTARLKKLGSEGERGLLEKYSSGKSVQPGGRKKGLAILKNIGDHAKYNEERDFPSFGTTRLSPHLHFGTISVREAYYHIKDILGKKNLLIQQLYWREFYLYVVKYINVDYSKKSVTLPGKNKMHWPHHEKKFSAWCRGMTGIPIVDAGMRQLNSTGWIHNRARMIVAIFLIWYLEIHWSHGEKYFAQNLVDYSYSNNFGGWVWCAGTETYSCDTRKIFSMSSQSKKYDPDANYIKEFVPELRDVEPRKIHDFEKYSEELQSAGYCAPIVHDLKKIREKNMKEFAKY